MLEILKSFELSTIQWCLAILCAMLIGMSKTGVSGVGLAVVPILAAVLGSKPSTGMVLTLLVVADAFAVSYYNRHAEWKYILRLMPWALAGIVIGAVIGKYSTGKIFNILLSVCILAGAGLMVWRDIRGKENKVPETWWFSAIMGLAGGFTTMIGNAAGPVMALYLLSIKLPKNQFIGTAAWFFMIINWIKMPIQIFYWHNITIKTLLFDVVLLPAIVVGVVAGILIVKKIPEKPYRILVIATTVLAASLLFFKNPRDKKEPNSKPVRTEKIIKFGNHQ